MNRYYPKINFVSDKKHDKSVIKMFGFSEQGLLDPSLRFITAPRFSKSREDFILAFLDDFYIRFEKEISVDLKNTQKKWEKVRDHFFVETDRIFDGWPWPKGDYVGYISIWWGRFPRWISKKTFSFPFVRSWLKNPRNPIKVTAHEILHFITYDYLQKKHGLKPSEHGSKDNSFWQFTENLNVLIENSASWNEMMKGQKSFPYDECRAQYDKMKEVWDKDQNLDNLIERILKNKV